MHFSLYGSKFFIWVRFFQDAEVSFSFTVLL